MDPADAASPRHGISRRRFLGHGSLLAGAATALAAIPGVGSLLASGDDDAPVIGGAATNAATETAGGAAAETSEPLVAHVVDASTGEINLYQGTQQITARDPALARALARLATSK